MTSLHMTKEAEVLRLFTLYASIGMWRDYLRRIPPIGFFLVEIRGAGPCRGGAHTLHGCVRWSPGYGHDGPGVCLGDGQTEAYLKDMGMTDLGRRPDGGRRSTVTKWTRRRAVPGYAPIPDLNFRQQYFFHRRNLLHFSQKIFLFFIKCSV